MAADVIPFLQALFAAAVYHVSKGDMHEAEDILRPLYDVEDLHNAYLQICNTLAISSRRHALACILSSFSVASQS